MADWFIVSALDLFHSYGLLENSKNVQKFQEILKEIQDLDQTEITCLMAYYDFSVCTIKQPRQEEER